MDEKAGTIVDTALQALADAPLADPPVPDQPQDAPPSPVLEPAVPTCPVCDAPFNPIVRVRDLAICGVCGSSLFVQDDTLRPTKYTDLELLELAELAQLRRGRGSIVRPDRRPKR